MISNKIKYFHFITFLLIAYLYSFVGVQHFCYERTLSDIDKDRTLRASTDLYSLTTIKMLNFSSNSFDEITISVSPKTYKRYQLGAIVFFILLLFPFNLFFRNNTHRDHLWWGIIAFCFLLWTVFISSNSMNSSLDISKAVLAEAHNLALIQWEKTYGEVYDTYLYNLNSNEPYLTVSNYQTDGICAWLFGLGVFDFYKYYKLRIKNNTNNTPLDSVEI